MSTRRLQRQPKSLLPYRPAGAKTARSGGAEPVVSFPAEVRQSDSLDHSPFADPDVEHPLFTRIGLRKRRPEATTEPLRVGCPGYGSMRR